MALQTNLCSDSNKLHQEMCQRKLENSTTRTTRIEYGSPIKCGFQNQGKSSHLFIFMDCRYKISTYLPIYLPPQNLSTRFTHLSALVVLAGNGVGYLQKLMHVVFIGPGNGDDSLALGPISALSFFVCEGEDRTLNLQCSMITTKADSNDYAIRISICFLFKFKGRPSVISFIFVKIWGWTKAESLSLKCLRKIEF